MLLNHWMNVNAHNIYNSPDWLLKTLPASTSSSVFLKVK